MRVCVCEPLVFLHLSSCGLFFFFFFCSLPTTAKCARAFFISRFYPLWRRPRLNRFPSPLFLHTHWCFLTVFCATMRKRKKKQHFLLCRYIYTPLRIKRKSPTWCCWCIHTIPISFYPLAESSDENPMVEIFWNKLYTFTARYFYISSYSVAEKW